MNILKNNNFFRSLSLAQKFPTSCQYKKVCNVCMYTLLVNIGMWSLLLRFNYINGFQLEFILVSSHSLSSRFYRWIIIYHHHEVKCICTPFIVTWKFMKFINVVALCSFLMMPIYVTSMEVINKFWATSYGESYGDELR